MIMNVFGRINSQILKFNVKKFLQMWSLYHPEDVNCQIIVHVMFKKAAKCDIDTIRRELRMKNSKSRATSAKNSCTSVWNGKNCRVRWPKNNRNNAGTGMNELKHFYYVNYGGWQTTNDSEEETRRRTTGEQREEPPECREQSVIEETRKCISDETQFALLRCLDNRGILECSQLFDTNIRYVKDLPLIMCYTDYHIEQLIKICQTAKKFPISVLPRNIQKDTLRLLRM